MAKMNEQREAALAAEERERQRQQKQEDEVVKDKTDAEVTVPRRATRAAVGAQGSSEQVRPVAKTQRGTAAAAKKLGKAPRRKKNGALGIADYFDKQDVKAEAGSPSVAAALEQAAGEEAGHPTALGAQALRSARQPALVTGGIMRNYQLEGLDWLISLYENGLNGILADEMGLGKTIQTIAFLAFLRSKKTYGPFLIAAPLSTLSNWVEEFAQWTPEVPVVLYHGSKGEREEIRHTKLVRPGSPEFPVVCTSYEICMNDRKFLAGYIWKFIVIVSGQVRLDGHANAHSLAGRRTPA